MVDVLSYGGGVQSVATVLLIAQGDLPKPDMAVFADTGREVSTTLEYAEQYTFPLLRALGVPVHVVKTAEFGLNGLWWGNVLVLPVFERTQTGVRQLRNMCSGNWKRQVLQRFLRRQGVRQCRAWLCISADEWVRVRDSREKWYQHWYPLVEKRITRNECVNIILQHGWPIPHKSRCWCCPYQSKAEWRSLRNSPDWDKAVQFEQEIRQHGFFLTAACVPLEEAMEHSSQLEFDLNGICDGGTCFV